MVKGLPWGQCRPLSTRSSYTGCECALMNSCHHEQPQRRSVLLFANAEPTPWEEGSWPWGLT